MNCQEMSTSQTICLYGKGYIGFQALDQVAQVVALGQMLSSVQIQFG